MINAANSTVGQVLIQLCAVLKLRCIAIVRGAPEPAGQSANDKLVSWLKSLGASDVVFDEKPLKVSTKHINAALPIGAWGTAVIH
jgi:trans-2-enoyl-CoA reductase